MHRIAVSKPPRELQASQLREDAVQVAFKAPRPLVSAVKHYVAEVRDGSRVVASTSVLAKSQDPVSQSLDMLARTDEDVLQGVVESNKLVGGKR